MTAFSIVWHVIVVLVFVASGWLCVFRPNILVTWGRKNVDPAYPFSDVILKGWTSPTYIRYTGLAIWFLAYILIYQAVSSYLR